jgi:hypothetical protein
MRFPLLIVTILWIILYLYGCSGFRETFQRKDQVYQPPRIGAEHRFEDGLRKEKHPQQLFSKKERKEMEKMGMTTEKERTAPNTRITAMQADSILTGKVRDTTQAAPTDSTQPMPADSLQSPPADTTRH